MFQTGPWRWPCVVLYFIKQSVFGLIEWTQAKPSVIIHVYRWHRSDSVQRPCWLFLRCLLWCTSMFWPSALASSTLSCSASSCALEVRTSFTTRACQISLLKKEIVLAGLPKTIQTDQVNQLGQAGMPDNHLDIGLSFG